MNLRTAIVLIGVLILAAACGGDDGDGANGTSTPASQPTHARTVVARTPAPSPASTSVAGDVEVSGVVGAVDAASNTIEITRISGVNVDRIEVGPATKIRKAGGGTATLAQIRPSNRVVATGSVSGAVLVATEITVQDVVPGPAPGG